MNPDQNSEIEDLPLDEVSMHSKLSSKDDPTGLQRRGSRRGIKGSTLSCHHLSYTVSITPPGAKCCAAKKPKMILRDVNGIFKPGMNAILGPTGGGKTSMLDVLACRKDPAGVKGKLLVDGHDVPKNFKLLTGYVVQDDVVMGTLTVRENLMFSANLRLSKSFTHDEKEARVEDTLQELGLSICADSKVGTEFIRGVSGGERKRTNIGMELIISPSVLFLDEPTTGLDASTSNAVMLLLKRLSLRGRTIIFSIHQPRYSIFKCFDRLMLLAAGRPVYHGPAKDGLSYFSSIGYECEAHNNPPDFFLDVINGDSTAVKHMEAQMDISENITSAELTVVTNKTLAETLGDKYETSEVFKDISDELSKILEKYTLSINNGTNLEFDEGEYATTFGTQLKYVASRTVRNLIRNPRTSIMQVLVTIIMAVIIGLIFLQIGDNITGGTQNRVGVLFFLVVNQMMSNLSSVELFIKERIIFLHETSSGFYRVSVYFFAKIICDMIPMRVIPLSLFSIITYFMIGLQRDAGKFFIYYFVLFLTTLCASAMGFVISASVQTFAIANLMVSLIYVITLVFGGLLVNLAQMGAWLNWVQYLSIIRYGLNALSINEMYGLEFFNYDNQSHRVPGSGNNTLGTTYLKNQGIPYSTAWDLWKNMMALCLIVLGLLALTYIQLRRLRRYK